MHPRPMGDGEQRVRSVIERLVRDGTAVARIDGTLHRLFPVAASAAEGEALRSGSYGRGRRRRLRLASATASRRCIFARACSTTPIPRRDTSPSTRIRRRGLRTVGCSFSTRRGSQRLWNTTRRSHKSCSRDSSAKRDAFTWRSLTATTASTGSSSTSSSSGGSYAREGSFSSTTIISPQSRALRRSV